MDNLIQRVFSAGHLMPVVSAISVFVVLLVSFLYWYGTRASAILKKMNLPGPKPRPFVGNLPDVKKYSGIHVMMLEYVKKYGKVFAITLGRHPSIVVADPEMLKQIMVKDFQNFRNRVLPGRQPAPFNKSVFSSRDEYWKRIRSTLTPTFSAGKMKLMVPLLEKSCNILLKKFDEIADSGQSVDVLDYFSKLTLEVILATAFGVDANIQTEPDSELLRRAKDVFRIPASLRLLNRFPLGKYVFFLLQYFRGVRRGFFPNVVNEIITARRQEGLTGRKDLLQLMLLAGEETTAEGTSKLTDEEIVAQSIIFLLAGYETSSNTLTFTSYHLAMNPDIQEKLRTEIQEAIASHPKKPLYDLTHSIEYLDCVINESLRLCPPAFQMNRECVEDYDYNGIHIPAGTEVIIPFYALHRDPDAWPEPEKYDPERFRGPAKEARHPYQYMPFGTGPRNCIGMRFALMEIKIALVRILSKYKLVASPETQVPLILHAGATLSARDGVHVRVETIN